MLRLIQADFASTGKPHLRNGTPSCFLNLRALNALLRQGSHLGFQAVAHEIEFVGTILIGRVECGFCRRQSEDQPAMTRIHGLEPENVAEKCAVRFGVLTVDNYVSARNHLPLLRIARNSSRAACSAETSFRAPQDSRDLGSAYPRARFLICLASFSISSAFFTICRDRTSAESVLSTSFFRSSASSTRRSTSFLMF